MGNADDGKYSKRKAINEKPLFARIGIRYSQTNPAAAYRYPLPPTGHIPTKILQSNSPD
jgi:hypothetical protein